MLINFELPTITGLDGTPFDGDYFSLIDPTDKGDGCANAGCTNGCDSGCNGGTGKGES